VGWLVTFVATYWRSIYFSKMQFSDHFHPGPDWPGTVIGPNLIDQSEFLVGNHYFWDLLMTILRSGERTPYEPTRDLLASDYPPFAHLIYKPLVGLPYHVAIFVYVIFSIALVVTPFLLANSARGISSRVSFLIPGVLLTYPVLFALDRGNNILLAVGALLFGTYTLSRQKYLLAAALFGLAASIKIYPVFFLLIFLTRKQWKAFGVAVATGILVSVGSLLSFQGGLARNIEILWGTTGNFRDQDGQINLNHSLYSFLVTIARSNFGWLSELSDFFATNYSFVSLLMIFAMMGLIILLRSHLIEQIVLICCLNVLIIPLTYGYALSVFLIVLLAIHQETTESWRLYFYAACIALLFVPKGFALGPTGAQLLNCMNAPLQLFMIAIVLTVAIGEIKTLWSRKNLGPKSLSTMYHGD
jgi:Glycosyltransferase family 87